MPRDSPPGVVCSGCGKHVESDVEVRGPTVCLDCGSPFVPATPERLACDRCGAEDASRVFNSEHNRLCAECIEWENSRAVPLPDVTVEQFDIIIEALSFYADRKWAPDEEKIRDVEARLRENAVHPDDEGEGDAEPEDSGRGIMDPQTPAEEEFRERMDEAREDPDVDEAEVYAEEIGLMGDREEPVEDDEEDA